MDVHVEGDRVLRLARTFDAPRERVFHAFTDAAELAQWFGPEGMDIPFSKIDPRPGGAWCATMRGNDSSHHVSGRYLEVVPPRRLVFTWAFHETADPATPREHETVVTIELHERGRRTELVLEQRLFRDRTGRDRHDDGWSSSLRCLDAYLAKSP